MWDQRNFVHYNDMQASQLQPTLQTHQQNKIINLLTQKIKTKLPKKNIGHWNKKLNLKS
jgi:hypothetical protein